MEIVRLLEAEVVGVLELVLELVQLLILLVLLRDGLLVLVGSAVLSNDLKNLRRRKGG